MKYELISEKMKKTVVDKTGDVIKHMVQYDYEITWEDLTLENLTEMVKALKKYIKKDLRDNHEVSIKMSRLYDSDFRINTEYTKYKTYIRWWLWYNTKVEDEELEEIH